MPISMNIGCLVACGGHALIPDFTGWCGSTLLVVQARVTIGRTQWGARSGSADWVKLQRFQSAVKEQGYGSNAWA
jgi:hypothetical protein